MTTAGGRETIVAGCRARGMAVDVVAHTYDDERDGHAVPGAPADALVDETARWLVAQLAPDAAGRRGGAGGRARGGRVTPTQNGGRVRVVHVIDSLAGSGGAENRLVDEVVALTPRFDQRVVRLFERDFFDVPLAAAGVPVTALGFRASTAGRAWPMIAYRLWRELRGDPPDVLHTSLFTGNLVGQLAGARLGVPVVSTFNRTGEIDLQRALQPGVSSWKGRTMQAIGRRVARLGDVHYRAVGDYARATNCKAMGLPLDACTAIPRGVHIDPAATERRHPRARSAYLRTCPCS